MNESDFPPGTFWRLTLRSGATRDAYVDDTRRTHWLSTPVGYSGPASQLGVPMLIAWWHWSVKPVKAEQLELRPVTL